MPSGYPRQQYSDSYAKPDSANAFSLIPGNSHSLSFSDRGYWRRRGARAVFVSL